MAPARRLHNMLAAYDDLPGALLKDDEFERFVYFCDFDHMRQNVQKWIERFDLDVRSSVAHDDSANVWFSERLRWRRRHRLRLRAPVARARPSTSYTGTPSDRHRVQASPPRRQAPEVCLRTPLARTKPCEVIVLHGNTNAAARPRPKDTKTNMMFRASLDTRDERPRSPAVLRSRFAWRDLRCVSNRHEASG